MTNEELIESLALLKEQARNSGANTFVWDINIDSFNFVMDSAIKAFAQEPTTKNNLAHNLCDSCTNIGCELQSGIVRTKCAFYMPSITPQEPTIKALGEELRKARNGIADEKVLIGYNMAVAICNKHLGESEE